MVLGSNVQNCQGWTAGSNLKKLRGVRAKFWAKLQIILNGTGLQVDFEKTQGLFNKCDRPNRYLAMRTAGSRSSGSKRLGCGFERGRGLEASMRYA